MGLFPPVSKDYVLAFQFSSWYPRFAKRSIKSVIIRPLPTDFQEYLNADGVFVPEGSENTPAKSTLSDDETTDISEEEDEDSPSQHYAFPDLDKRIRECIDEFGAVFPKLNFSSPKDASWVLPSFTPLKCDSPADVYLLLKSSDFINHDLVFENIFEGCDAAESEETSYELELVLRKWYAVDRGREVRCFVRDNVLLGVSQRDTNYYEFWNDEETKRKVVSAVEKFWIRNIRDEWTNEQHYTFDLLLTRDLSRAHILDFNPYMKKTDPLLFTYDELKGISKTFGPDHSPILHVIDSPSHPAATRNAPAHQHNRIPFDAISISNGRDIEEFAELWKESIEGCLKNSDD